MPLITEPNTTSPKPPSSFFPSTPSSHRDFALAATSLYSRITTSTADPAEVDTFIHLLVSDDRLFGIAAAVCPVLRETGPEVARRRNGALAVFAARVREGRKKETQ
ncbi:hypothetical protein NpPPO83_00005341 [Neofusicoccum parvum]|uniref:Uncharacterized protein n=1 Tax=Neofusicoccum parvum TaxID=310453 RepID=A0ACB5SF81_9PEZI|nr:hypothetical protein NpPPO83_00005341 [Neofusicoccum parvum]